MESSLIAAAKGGDASAFETLMGAYERKVYALCLRMMGNPHDGEDCAQEAMLRIWQKPRKRCCKLHRRLLPR